MFLAYAFFLNKFAILNASPPQMTTIPITIIIIADPLIMKHLGPSWAESECICAFHFFRLMTSATIRNAAAIDQPYVTTKKIE